MAYLSEAIYFDGHLPADKLPVRKSRAFRRTTELGSLYRSNPLGCCGSFLNPHDADDSRCYTSPRPKHRHAVPQNPFTVQAIIDTLKLSRQYSAVTQLVPGEADAFCAEAARKTRDAVILTSDSDLLLYDIGNSCVLFLDDIHLSDKTPTLCLKFSPSSLGARLGLVSTASAPGIRRFAFELVKKPHASLLQLLDACKGPFDAAGCAEFTRDYDAQQNVSSLPLGGFTSASLDARLLELAIQLNSPALHLPRQVHSPHKDGGRIFLPTPIENYGRSSCFDPSSEVRRIAYSLLSSREDMQDQVVWEFKRLHTPVGRGASVPLCSLGELPGVTHELASALSSVASHTGGDDDYFWPTIALGLDARYSSSEGKTSVVSTLAGITRHVSEMSSIIPWDLVHFQAQVHACCYSFRVLGQVLSFMQKSAPSELVDIIYSHMRPYISRVQPLSQFPATEHIRAFVSPVPRESIMARILHALELKGLAPTTLPLGTSPSKGRKNRRGNQAGQTLDSGNPFAALLDCEE